MSTRSLFKCLENKHDVYRGKDCMKKFFKYLIEHTMKIINFKKKKVQIINKLTTGIIWKKHKTVIIVKRKTKRNMPKIKVRDYCHCTEEYRGAVHSICNLK